MPSASPGSDADAAASFTTILPGAPVSSLQACALVDFRFKHYAVYISGRNLNILSSPTTLVQVIAFEHELSAVAAAPDAGRLLVACQQASWVLEGVAEGWTKVWWEKTLCLRHALKNEPRWLSWGSEGEVLVGGTLDISLYSSLPSSRNASPIIAGHTGEHIEQRQPLWSRPVSSPILFAEFSPSATLIASCARADRLVKIWRRLSFEEGLFDYGYLPHPSPVTHLQWKPRAAHLEERRGSGTSGRHDEDSEVLYSFASDGTLRLWRAGGHQDLDVMALFAAIDLVAAIPQSPSLSVNGSGPSIKNTRHVFIIPSDDFRAAVNATVGLGADDKVNHSLEHLKEIASSDSEIIVALDGQGRMSAWGIESIGHKRRSDTPALAPPFHITHVEGLHLRFPPGVYVAFRPWLRDDQFHMLTLSLGADPEISWWRGRLEHIISPSRTTGRIVKTATWNGHDAAVVDLVAGAREAVSWSERDVCLWKMHGSGAVEFRRCLRGVGGVLSALCVEMLDVLVLVREREVSVWSADGQVVAKQDVQVSGSGTLQLFEADHSSAWGVFVSTDGHDSFGWSLDMRSRTLSDFQLEGEGELFSRLDKPVKLAKPVPSLSDGDARYIAAISSDGKVCFAVINRHDNKFSYSTNRILETKVVDPTLFTACPQFFVVAAADRHHLSIFDAVYGYLEYSQPSSEEITSVECFANSSGVCAVAVGRTTRIEILLRVHHERNHDTGNVWHSVKTVGLERGLQCAGVSWTCDGTLLVTAGNGFLVLDSRVRVSTLASDLQETVRSAVPEQQTLDFKTLGCILAAPLPVWHPEYLTNLILSGKLTLVAGILQLLARKLKFWSQGEDLERLLRIDPENLGACVDQQDGPGLDEETLHDLVEQLDGNHMPFLNARHRRLLKHIARAVAYVGKHADGLDDFAQQYLYAWQLQLLISTSQTSPSLDAESSDRQPSSAMQWREIAMARQSQTQQPLLDILLTHYGAKLDWPIARNLGITFWLSEQQALAQIFEQLAQAAYRSEQPPDPVNASLFFLALHKKPTLVALWRIATWHKEQKPTMNFLKRDFAHADAKTAAKKNAYALMGKRRFHYAASFFLLADDPDSAVSLLASQCEDSALAVAVARMYSGAESSTLHSLVRDRLLPGAEIEGNRWFASWCYTAIADANGAADALIRSPPALPQWSHDVPDTLLLYQHLRPARPSPDLFPALLRAAHNLRTTGLLLPALHLVRDWTFRAESSSSAPNGHSTKNPPVSASPMPEHTAPQTPSLLDSFADLSITPAPSTPDNPKLSREAQAAELLRKLKAKKTAAAEGKGLLDAGKEMDKEKRQPTQFKEPDANSLLDSFGF